MDPSSLDRLPPVQLAKLLDLDTALPRFTDDAAAILRHQLAAPLLPDLIALPSVEVARIRSLIPTHPEAATFLAQLTSPAPSLELLDSIKQFARHCEAQPSHPLHGPPATALYFAAIAAALIRCKTRITRLNDADLRNGFMFAIEQPGGEALRPVFAAALQQLERK